MWELITIGIGGANGPFASCLLPQYQNKSKCETIHENDFCMQVHFHANQSHLHKNGFTVTLALKQRRKETLKWPIQ